MVNSNLGHEITSSGTTLSNVLSTSEVSSLNALLSVQCYAMHG